MGANAKVRGAPPTDVVNEAVEPEFTTKLQNRYRTARPFDRRVRREVTPKDALPQAKKTTHRTLNKFILPPVISKPWSVPYFYSEPIKTGFKM